MNESTKATLYGCAIVALGLLAMTALIAGPEAAGQVIEGAWDGLVRVRRVVVPWP